MRHRKFTFKIGRSSAHRSAMLANQVSSLIMLGEIRTTIVKAKQSRRLAEKMITYAKKGDIHHRQLALAKLRDKDAVKKLFDELVKKYTDRQGGYTRIMRLGQRLGDGAEMCILQFVGEEDTAKPAKKKSPAKKAEKKAEGKKPAGKKAAAKTEAKAEEKK
ncbi:MAG TPA: 50S ribosomal protein L17 [Lentisphaeria bacterium]|nr:MAG: 50S ribosomal protein L17 [Lentisphaerae bacterium GWF2_50_93]HCE46855.1 50S ribosomal protein L17 [Lentisphaeria bacterium]